MSCKNIILLFIISVLLLIPLNISAEVQTEKATFAGGCFWCMEHPFENLDGVSEVVSGYTGGCKKNPTYEEISLGVTFHYESIQVTYDPSIRSYSELLDVFWRQIDPTDPGGQFVDRGLQYRTAVFYLNDEQKSLAEESRERLDKSGRYDKEIVTEIKEATVFYEAEEYHQDFYKKSMIRYKAYRNGSGRDKFLERIWGKKMETEQSNKYKIFKKPSKEALLKN